MNTTIHFNAPSQASTQGSDDWREKDLVLPPSLPPSLPRFLSLAVILKRGHHHSATSAESVRRPRGAHARRAGMRKGIPLPLPPSLFCACARRATIPFLSHFHPIFAMVGFCNAAAAVAWHKVGDFPLALALALLRLGLRWYQASIAYVSSQGD